MDISKLINGVIPPADYSHRNGFSNNSLIDSLNEAEKSQLEDALIQKIFEAEGETDLLVVETLSYLKSEKSIPILEQLLEGSSDPMRKLIISTSIFGINRRSEIVELAIACLREIDDDKNPYNKYTLPTAFYYLSKFKSEKANKVIGEYLNHRESLIAYNAKRAIEEGGF